MNGRDFTEKIVSLGENFYRVAYHILEDEAEAKDAVQDLYIRLWDSRDALDGIRNPLGYGIAVLRNLCIDRIRSRKPVVALSEEIESEAPPSSDSREQLERTLKAIEKLPCSQRDVLRMRVIEELSYEEMQQRTGMSNLTLRVLLSQARNRLRKTL